MKHRLAILDDYQDVASGFADWAALEAEGVTVTTFREPVRLPGCAGVGAGRHHHRHRHARADRLPARGPRTAPGAETAGHHRHGQRRHRHRRAAADLGITVCGTPGSPAAAPELTWALLLALARHLPAEEASLRAGTWQSTVGFELAGKTLGIVGLGKIGRRIAGYGKAFGMDVVAWSQNLTAEPRRSPPGPGWSARRNCSAPSDVATLHLRLSARSENVVDEHGTAAAGARRDSWSTPPGGRWSTRTRWSGR